MQQLSTVRRNSILLIPWVPFMIWFAFFRPEWPWPNNVLLVYAIAGGAMFISIALSRLFPPPEQPPMEQPPMKHLAALVIIGVLGMLLATSAFAFQMPNDEPAPDPVCAESFSNSDQRVVVDCLGRLVRLQLRDGRMVHFVFSDNTMQPFAASVDGVNYFRAPTLPRLTQPKHMWGGYDDFGGAGGTDGGGAGLPGGGSSGGGYTGGGYGGGGYGGGGGYEGGGYGGYDPYREVIEVVERAYRDAQATADYIIARYAAHNPGVDPMVCDTMCDLMGQSGGLACIAAGIINASVGGVCAAYMLGVWGFCRYKCLYP